MDNFEQIAINLIENIENAEGQRRGAAAAAVCSG